MAVQTPAINMDKLNAFMGQVVGELGATVNAGLIVLGDRLGLYKAMAESGPITSAELAEKTGTAERYVREWLNAQAAGGFVEYTPETQRYLLPPEQAMALANEESPAFVCGAFELATASLKSESQIESAFRSGAGFGWHQHDLGVSTGCERFFRPGYNANLVSSWLPALEGVEAKLGVGAKVADVGCGLGASTRLMAQAYPRSRFTGFDYHPESIELARQKAKDAGLQDRATFEVAKAAAFPGSGYDLIAMFDCLHDMGDPVGAARHVRQALAADGTWLIVEPIAGDRVEQNLNPVGRAYYAFSTFLCTPNSLSQDVGLALGAQAGEARIKDVATAGGFTRFRRVAETPFNVVYEVRP
ncbi:MAG: methyltransferase domain-containing protein [Chloroflexi bacterium]|nr:MAG: methyltransferase domain-containing protein [Chloroflexota bacterium]TMF19109.1 MAG: methyltransferase domain-containing protein [Chloroflexota bacterium]TMF32517.1 MAG: methyltransferase domain-containing protein [Chloroflexota bacterium]TMG28290.1 MAG: methyltransferase domain-containing protein [Chloroflexota bacterium]